MIRDLALTAKINFFYPADDHVVLSTDEVTTLAEINAITGIFAKAAGRENKPVDSLCDCNILEESFQRKTQVPESILL